MVTKDEMMDILRAACPSFAPLWQAFLADWENEPGELPLYIALGDFARHLIVMLEQNGDITECCGRDS